MSVCRLKCHKTCLHLRHDDQISKNLLRHVLRHVYFSILTRVIIINRLVNRLSNRVPPDPKLNSCISYRSTHIVCVRVLFQ
jgi:hypothetical protein